MAEEKVIVTGTPVTAQPEKIPTKRFRLKPGYSHSHGSQVVTAGDELELTEVQARAFADRFEPVDHSSFTVKEESTATVHPSTIPGTTPSHEAVQAQEDKRKGEAEAAKKMGIGGDAVRTVDSTKGTVKSDPDGTAQKL